MSHIIKAALEAAKATIQIDRTSLADTSMRPDNTMDPDGAQGVAEYDAVLGQIDAGLVALPDTKQLRGALELADQLEQRFGNTVPTKQAAAMLRWFALSDPSASAPAVMTDEQATLLNQAHDLLLAHADNQRSRGNDSEAKGAECSADAVLKLAAAWASAPVPAAEQAEPVAYFSYGDDSGYIEHATAEAASAQAKEDIDTHRNDAVQDNEWPGAIDSVCWGIVVQKATAVDHSDEDGRESCDYTLGYGIHTHAQPERETMTPAEQDRDDAARDVVRVADTIEEAARFGVNAGIRLARHARHAREPMTPKQKDDAWTSATIDLPSPRNCYMRGIADAEAFHCIGITAKAGEKQG